MDPIIWLKLSVAQIYLSFPGFQDYPLPFLNILTTFHKVLPAVHILNNSIVKFLTHIWSDQVNLCKNFPGKIAKERSDAEKDV